MSDVAATLALWSPTSASNSPADATAIGTGLADNLRTIQGVIARGLSNKGSDIASASTTDLGAVEGLAHDITGVTTITGFGTVRAGILKVIKFEGALTLTHNATTLILPGAANITTADGDVALVISEGSGNWRCLTYMKAASIAATLAGTETLTNKTLTSPTLTTATLNGNIAGTSIATQANMEAASSAVLIVTPGREIYHPGVAKCACIFDGTGTPAILGTAYNVSSITDNGDGDWTINLSVTFSSVNWFPVVFGGLGNSVHLYFSAITATTLRVVNSVAGAYSAADADRISFVGFGDLS